MLKNFKKAFEHVDLDWENYVVTSERYFRPNEVNFLLGDYSKAKKNLDGIQKQALNH